MDKLLLTAGEAAHALGIGRSKLYELMARGAIASVRLDGSRRLTPSALADYVHRLEAGVGDHRPTAAPVASPLGEQRDQGWASDPVMGSGDAAHRRSPAPTAWS